MDPKNILMPNYNKIRWVTSNPGTFTYKKWVKVLALATDCKKEERVEFPSHMPKSQIKAPRYWQCCSPSSSRGKKPKLESLFIVTTDGKDKFPNTT